MAEELALFNYFHPRNCGSSLFSVEWGGKQRPLPPAHNSIAQLRYCYGSATEALRYCSHVDAINMGAIPEQYRSNTGAIPVFPANTQPTGRWRRRCDNVATRVAFWRVARACTRGTTGE